MNFKSCFVILGVVACVVVMGEANLAQARGFGNRGGTAVRIGIGRSRNRPPRYHGPAFYAAPRSYGSYRYGSTQFQQRLWYYYRSGPFEYYRPYNPLFNRVY